MTTYGQITQFTYPLLFWLSLEVLVLVLLLMQVLPLSECTFSDHSTSEVRPQLVTTELFSVNKKPKTNYVRGFYAQ